MSPWDIETALAQPTAVEPGDAIWLLPGLYRLAGTLTSKLRGKAAKPIMVRSRPEEGGAVLEFADCRSPVCFHILGEHTHYRGFELRNSRTQRWSEVPGDAGNPRGIGILSEGGLGTKLIQLRVHDFGTSLFESQASGIEINGCAFYNSYWNAPDRSHGPGLYIRNLPASPRKRLEGNLIFQHGRQGLQGFGSTPFAGFDVVRNAVFNNGIAEDGFHRNLMFGSSAPGQFHNSFVENCTYFPTGASPWHSNMFGGVSGCRDLELRDNIFGHFGRVALDINMGDELTVKGNRLVGGLEVSESADGQEMRMGAVRQRFPTNEFYDIGFATPKGSWARIMAMGDSPDLWEHVGRAWVVIYNWSRESSVEVDLSCLEAEKGLMAGHSLMIGSVQNPDHKIEVRYDGSAARFPMTGWQAVAPAGRDLTLNPLPGTFPEFGVFSLEWAVGGLSDGREEPDAIQDPGAGMDANEARKARWSVWKETDSERRMKLLEERLLAWRHRLLQRAN